MFLFAEGRRPTAPVSRPKDSSSAMRGSHRCRPPNVNPRNGLSGAQNGGIRGDPEGPRKPPREKVLLTRVQTMSARTRWAPLLTKNKKVPLPLDPSGGSRSSRQRSWSRRVQPRGPPGSVPGTPGPPLEDPGPEDLGPIPGSSATVPGTPGPVLGIHLHGPDPGLPGHRPNLTQTSALATSCFTFLLCNTHGSIESLCIERHHGVTAKRNASL
jgi:hypothetical protein